jgi:hypothetical protein
MMTGPFFALMRQASLPGERALSLFPVAVLHVSGMHGGASHYAKGIDRDVTLHGLFRIKAARHAFSVVLTNWLSAMPAEGLSLALVHFLRSHDHQVADGAQKAVGPPSVEVFLDGGEAL